MPQVSILIRIQPQWMKRVIVLEDNLMTPIYFVSLISKNDVFLETLQSLNICFSTVLTLDNLFLKLCDAAFFEIS